MAHVGTISTRIRDDDYEAARKETEQKYPVQIVDLLAAWRRRWQASSEDERLASLRQVRRVGRGRRPQMAR